MGEIQGGGVRRLRAVSGNDAFEALDALRPDERRAVDAQFGEGCGNAASPKAARPVRRAVRAEVRDDAAGG
jgi:hypothetical protein